MTDRFSLKGRIALVTGASRGLGLAMAEALAGQGARVVLNGRDPETLRSAAAKLCQRACVSRRRGLVGLTLTHQNGRPLRVWSTAKDTSPCGGFPSPHMRFT
jgi:NAD(P)-dependent dehydrogenase (short-subunit alcohol dehydrogenase family)